MPNDSWKNMLGAMVPNHPGQQPNWVPGIIAFRACKDWKAPSSRPWGYEFSYDTRGGVFTSGYKFFKTKKEAEEAARNYVKLAYHARLVEGIPAHAALIPGPFQILHGPAF